MIIAKPLELDLPHRWNTDGQIERHTGDSILVRDYFPEKTFPSEEEAVVYSLRFGREIIDGKHPEWSPP